MQPIPMPFWRDHIEGYFNNYTKAVIMFNEKVYKVDIFHHYVDLSLVGEVQHVEWSKIQTPTDEVVVPYDTLALVPEGTSHTIQAKERFGSRVFGDARVATNARRSGRRP
ncbi:UDP-glucose pyrophosphorylase 1 [Striga asiatica]|uniref:UDP-glucose pyrophosphorylase 1 n=1 Tax=Striga asiatica TaxID=4170 RepID=A0A5A7P9T1_STRAF|nr:UDP-glucose pyrophosphorylase 1 [Striga asiatica]